MTPQNGQDNRSDLKSPEHKCLFCNILIAEWNFLEQALLGAGAQPGLKVLKITLQPVLTQNTFKAHSHEQTVKSTCGTGCVTWISIKLASALLPGHHGLLKEFRQDTQQSVQGRVW